VKKHNVVPDSWQIKGGTTSTGVSLGHVNASLKRLRNQFDECLIPMHASTTV